MNLQEVITLQYYVGKYSNMGFLETNNIPYFEVEIIEGLIINELKKKQDILSKNL